VLEQAVLHIDFFGLVAGEGGVEAGEQAGFLEKGQLIAIEEISASSSSQGPYQYARCMALSTGAGLAKR
jgi:hypothetical protein